MKKIYDGFEGETLSNIWSNSKLERGAYEIQNKIVKKGKQALKITIHRGDKAEPGSSKVMTERDELLERKELQSKEDTTYEYSFSLFLPKDFPIVPTRLVLAQWKQKEGNNNVTVNNPLIAIRYQKGELRITLQTTEEKVTLFRTKEEIRYRWLDFKFQIRFSRDKKGVLKVWMNKRKIIDYKGITAYTEKYGYPSKGTFYFKMGLYRDEMNEPMTVYIDEYSKKISNL